MSEWIENKPIYKDKLTTGKYWIYTIICSIVYANREFDYHYMRYVWMNNGFYIEDSAVTHYMKIEKPEPPK